MPAKTAKRNLIQQSELASREGATSESQSFTQGGNSTGGPIIKRSSLARGSSSKGATKGVGNRQQF